MDEFDIYDWEIRRRFRGKVFLFERCIVYTEILEREYLEYRGYLSSDKLGIIFKEGKSKFKLFVKRKGQKEVDFRANMNTVIEWNNIITGMLMKFAVEGEKNELKLVRKDFLKRKLCRKTTQWKPNEERIDGVFETNKDSRFCTKQHGKHEKWLEQL